MENLFASSVTEKIINRIGKLDAGIAPLWGKMNVSQMLAHCSVPIGASLGDQQLKRSFIGYLFGSMAKKSLLKDKPFPKNLPTDKSFVISGQMEFEIERQKLVAVIHRFAAANSASFSHVHPFFGKMHADEWGILTYKHLDHHLQQFGV
ncbi:MAG: DUF1569 domain-containing protein [Chitinophagaceae bacterium]